MFKKLEGDTAVLVQKGVYKPCDLYTWDGKLFAKITGGYVRLRSNGTTTKDGVSITHLEYEGNLYADKFGRMLVSNRANAKPLTGQTWLEVGA